VTLLIDYCREDEDRKERRKKFRRNEIEYAQHLKAKFFSNKNFTTGNQI
jgi:hypothetical protein